MGYSEKLQRLCALRGLDQATLADQVGLSRSTISRIISGIQEPKLKLAHDLAKALGVTLDYLVEETLEIGPGEQLVALTEEERMILKIVRRLGSNVAIDRLLNVPPAASAPELRAAALLGGRGRNELPRYEAALEDRSDT